MSVRTFVTVVVLYMLENLYWPLLTNQITKYSLKLKTTKSEMVIIKIDLKTYIHISQLELV